MDDDDESGIADEVERTAELNPGAAKTAPTGKAEIELERANQVVTSQEIEVELKRLPANALLTLVVDSHELASFKTNKKGSADLKFTSKQSGS